MISSRSVLPEGSDRRLMAAAILYMVVGCFVPMGLGDLRTEYQTQISTKGINFERNHIGSLISLPKFFKAGDHSIFNDILRREKIAADISPPNNQLPDILKKKPTLKYNELNFNKIPEEKVIPPHLPFAREFSSTSHSTGGTPKQTIRTTETENYEKFSGKSRSINVFEEHLPQEDENPIGSDRPTEVQVPNKQSTTLIPQSNSTFEGTTAKLAQIDYNSEVSELSDLPIPNKSCITDPAEPESTKEDDSTPFIHKFIDTFKDIFGTILQAGDTKSLPDDTVCGRPSVLSSQIQLSSADQTMENNLPNPISQLTDLLSIIPEEDEENEGSGTTSELTTQSNLTDEFGLFENYPNWEKSVETSMQQLVDMFNKQVSEIEKEHENPIPNEFEEQSINKFKEKYVKPSKEKDNSKLPKLLHIHEPFKLSPLSSSHSLSQIEGGFTVQITPLQDSRTTNTNHQKEGRSEGGIPTQIMHKYADFSITSQKPLLVDRFKETTNKNVMGSTGSPKLPPASGRPPFAGLTGGGPPQQLIPSGKPWPARPEDYADFSITSQRPQLVDRFKETTNKDKSSNSTSNDVMGLSGPPKLPSASGRPPFAGLTGGGPPQQLIPSGKPWPARPEDYADFSISSQKPQLVDRFKETTNKDKSSNSTANDVMGSSGSSKLPSNNFQKARSDFRIQDSTKLQRLYTTQHTRMTSTASQEITRPSIGQASAQSYKQWPSKHADEMFAKIKQDIFFSKRISLDASKWPEVSDLLLPNGDIHQKIFKHKTHVNRNGSVKTSEQ